MSIANSLLVALIVMSIVFCCLIALSLILKVQSFIFKFINDKEIEKKEVETTNNINLQKRNIEISNGELKLIGVDEKTTVMIMAVLSNELKISLDEIKFKSIKLIDS